MAVSADSLTQLGEDEFSVAFRAQDTVIHISGDGRVAVWHHGQPVAHITRLVLVADHEQPPILQISQRATNVNPVSSRHYMGVLMSSIDQKVKRWE